MYNTTNLSGAQTLPDAIKPCLMCFRTAKEFGEAPLTFLYIYTGDIVKRHCHRHSLSTTSSFLLQTCGVLTASMPESCMPTLITTTLNTCHRTVSSRKSFHTDSISTDDRERCSSCISSISAWMLHLALYHFRAERQEAAQLQDIMERCSSTSETY